MKKRGTAKFYDLKTGEQIYPSENNTEENGQPEYQQIAGRKRGTATFRKIEPVPFTPLGPTETAEKKEENDAYQEAVDHFIKTGSAKKTPDYNIHAFGAHTQTETDNDVSERLWSTLKGSAKSYAGQYLGTAGSAMEGAAVVNEQLYDQQTEQQRTAAKNSVDYWTKKMSEAATETERQTAQAQINRNQRYLNALAGNKKDQTADVRTAAEKLYETSDKLGDSAGSDFASAKEGTGWLGGLAVDTIAAGTQMAADALLGGGSALIPMAVRSFGGGASQARDEGATYGQQMLYGAGSAALSTITEKLSSVAAPFQKMFGKGILDEAIQKAAGKMLQNPVGKVALSFASEGAEEVIEDAVQPLLQKMTYDKDRTYTADDLANAINDGLVGGILGALGGGAEVIGNNVRTKQAFGQAQSEVDVEAGLADEALKIDPENKTALRAKKRTEEGETLSGGTLNKLIAQNESAFARQDKDAVKQAVANRLTELGETGNVDAVADAVTVRHSGQTMTREQSKALRNSKYGVRVANELLRGDITAGETGTNAENGAAEAPASAQEDEYAADVKLPGVENRGDARAPWNVEVNNQTAAPNGWGIETEDAAPESVQTVETNAVKEAPVTSGTGKTEGKVYGLHYVNGEVKVAVKSEDGSVKEMADTELKLPEKTQELVQGAKKFGAAAPVVYQVYLEGQNTGAYLRSAEYVIALGKATTEANKEKLMAYMRQSNLANQISPMQQEILYNVGRDMAADKETGGKRGAGTVTWQARTEREKVSKKQAAALSVVDALAEKLGVDFVIVESTADENGKLQGYNGKYENGKIYLDLNAGMYQEGDLERSAILRTTSHELTHWMAEQSPETYKKLQSFLLENLTEWKETTLDELVESKQARASVDLSYEDALDEVTADGCEMMLRDSSAVEKLAKEDKTLFEKVKSWIENFLKNMREAFAGVKAEHREAVYLMEKYADELQQLWDQGLKASARAEGQKNNAPEGVKARASERDYSYEEFIRKPDMRVIGTNDTSDYEANKKSRVLIVEQALRNAASVGSINENGSAVVHVKDIGADVIIPRRSLVHGLDRRMNTQAPVLQKIGSILQNAVRINELTPRSERTQNTYVLIGAAKGTKGNYIACFVINSESDEVSKINVLYSANAKKESAALLPKITELTATPTDSTISISKLLDYVNQYFPDVLPESVLKHYGHDARPEGKLGENALFSERDELGAQIAAVADEIKARKAAGEGTTAWEEWMEDLQEKETQRKENAALKRQVADLQKRIRTGSYRTLNEKDVKAVTGRYKKETGTSLSREEIEAELTNLYEYIANNGAGEDELTFSGVKEKAESVAEKMILGIKEISNEDMVEIGKEIRSITRQTPITLAQQDRAELDTVGGYEKFRRDHMGSLRLVKSGGTGADELYSELEDKYPSLFDSAKITHPGEMLMQISEVLEHTRPRTENPYSENMEAAISGLANQILEDYYQVRENSSMQYRKSYTQRLERLLEKEKKEHEEEIQKIRDQFTAKVVESNEKRRTEERVRQLRKTVTRNASRLTEKLEKNTDKKHIPEPLKKPLAEFLSTVNFTSKTALQNRGIVKADRNYIDALRALKDILTKEGFEQGQQEETKKVTSSGSIDLPNGFEETINNHLQAVQKILDENGNREYVVNAMSEEELETLNMVLNVTSRAVTTIDELFANKRYQKVSQMAHATFAYMGKKPKFDPTLEGFKALLSWQQMTPTFALRKYGPGGEAVMDSLKEGYGKFAFLVDDIMEFANQTYTAAEVKEWEKQTYVFDILDRGSGGTVKLELPAAQIMSLYELVKRDQALGHIMGGGIVPERFKKGRKAKEGSEGISLTMDDITSVLSVLTPRQIEVADKLQQYMQNVGSKWGNEISMARFGYNFFGEANYFPIESNKGNTDAKGKKQNEDLYRLQNLSATKALTENANNSIMLRDIFDVFSNHMTDMAKYNTMVLPLMDAMKFFNYRESNPLTADPEDTGIRERSVQNEIKRAYGNEGKNYFLKLIQDLNGTDEGGRGEEWTKKLVSNYKRAAVSANLRVAIQQPTAIFRATYVIPYKYLAGAVAEKTNMKKAIEEMEKNSGIAKCKANGFFDMDVGFGVRNQIKHAESKLDKAIDASMKPAEWGDKVTWAFIWKACKSMAAEKRLTGDALIQETTRIFEDVIYKTQVVDSPLTRSQQMRGNSAWNKFNTAFMSEPTLSYNLIMDAVMTTSEDAKTMGMNVAVRRNANKLITAFQAYTASAVAAAVAESIADAFRDDDDYETWLQKFWEAFWGWDGNMASDMNPLSKLPGLKDVISIFGGYQTTRMDIASFEDLYKSGAAWIETYLLAEGKLENPTSATYNGNMTLYGKIMLTEKGMSKLSGIPASSLTREAQTLWNNTVGYKWPGLKLKTYDAGDEAEIQYAFKDGYISEEEAQKLLEEKAKMDGKKAYYRVQRWKEGTGYSRYDELENAVASGDKKAIAEQVKSLKDHAVEEKDIKSDLTKRFKPDYLAGSAADRAAIRVALVSTGLYESADAVNKMCAAWLKK